MAESCESGRVRLDRVVSGFLSGVFRMTLRFLLALSLGSLDQILTDFDPGKLKPMLNNAN